MLISRHGQGCVAEHIGYSWHVHHLHLHFDEPQQWLQKYGERLLTGEKFRIRNSETLAILIARPPDKTESTHETPRSSLSG
jgi:hypothetical protein